MRLLIITQVIDSNHPILGFFHRSVEEFSQHCEQVTVICLQKGKCDLPDNVRVFSLGKEEGKGRLTYLWRFYKILWQHRHDYDQVFVHMNQEYVLLAGLYWRLRGIKLGMWRNHYSGSFLTHIAAWLCNQVYFTSESSYTARFSNSVRMPIGLDELLFKPKEAERASGSLLYVGRISRSKRIDMILAALKEAVGSANVSALTIVGGPSSIEDESYLKELKEFAAANSLPVKFAGPTPWADLPEIYSAHELCINMSPPGMFDKVIGEAILCGCDIVTTNMDLKDLLGNRSITVADTTTLTDFFKQFKYEAEAIEKLRNQVLERHSLSALVKQVLQI
ncbi:glycosyltransferase family 4 protein [Candidatus Nomurabacteria bacterium]|nr:glycosyltransferase family 4 protein [Candidatus Kaiserbacteria bacterium]MCB9815103.1 glycosyltransferase family 4 protein [Candidatus Nomurabacteria bacterium]